MKEAERKQGWRDAFYKAAGIYEWLIIAWVVLDNHYHAIVRAPASPETLSKFVGSYHKFTARDWNDRDHLKGRKIWWNYWDTCIRSERDFVNRLKYVFWNPVKHGLITTPEDYPFSNYKEFMTYQFGLDFTDSDEVTDVPEF